MRRFLCYILAAASIPVFSRFQESVTFQDGVVVHAARIYDQTIGIVVASAVAVLCVLGVIVGWRSYRVQFRDVLGLPVAIFALPALWNNWSLARYGGGGFTTEITSGVGGPLAGRFFLVAAAAFIAAELYFRSRCNPLKPQIA